MALREPNTKAKRPIMQIITFFIATQLNLPNPMSQYVTVSMNTGTRRPRIEKQNAPISPIKGPIVGTATASKTAKQRENIKY